jgi:putative hydrolase of the HAD superfamily
MDEIKAILFDWGDTLMVDYPQFEGKMCNWPKVAAVEGAKETLIRLSKQYHLYLATNAQDSTLIEIESALQRVDLLAPLTGVFCKSELGVDKKSPEFYPTIVKRLGLPPSNILMVGDSIIKDITPAKQAGLQTVWLTQSGSHSDADTVCTDLTTLLESK